MRKKIGVLLLAGLMATGIPALGEGAAAQQPLYRGDISYYALRPYSEALGYTVEWQAAARRITLRKEAQEIQLTPGSTTVLVKGNYISLASPLFSENGITYISMGDAGRIFSAAGADTSITAPDGLTKQQLYETALTYDKDLRIMQNALAKSGEVVKEAELQNGNALYLLPYYGNGSVDAAINSAWQGVLSSRIQEELNKKGIENRKDVLKLQIDAQYDALVAMINGNKVLQEVEAVAQTTAAQGELKYGQGLISQLEYNRLKAAYDSAKSSRVMNEATIAEARQTLSSLTGVAAERLNLSEANSFMPLEGFNAETAYADAQRNSYVLFSLDKSRLIAKYGLDYYVFNSGQTPYKAKEYDLSNAELELQKEMDRERKVILNTWQQILQAEEQHYSYQSDRAQKLEEVKALELQKSLGLATELQVRSGWLAIRQLDSQIEANIVKHAALKRTLSKPWLSN